MDYNTNPTSKADLVDRILSQTFSGDLRQLAADGTKLKVARPKPHVVQLVFEEPGGPAKEFLLAIHKPKPERARLAAKKRWASKRKAHTATKPQEKPNRKKAGRYN